MDGLLTSRASHPLSGEVRVPGDKSVSHRAVMLASLARARSRIRGLLDGGDCRATLSVMRALGTQVETGDGSEIIIKGKGLGRLSRPDADLDCAGSGTTMRLLAGVIAGQPVTARLTGTPQLLARPMDRIIEPLTLMGAKLTSGEGRAPLEIRGRRKLTAIDYELPVASAQVKSCILLAGLRAEGITSVREPGPARDHTERMLGAMGVRVEGRGRVISVMPPKLLRPLDITVPGDISSAAFLMVAATLVDGSEVHLRDVGINPTRTGIVEALLRMGARIEVSNERFEGGEPVGDITVRSTELAAASFEGSEIVTMIDELPVLALAATQARGWTTIRGAGELRVKETDRIATTTGELRKLGARIEPLEDGMEIEGPTDLVGTACESHGDHRLAMTLAVAGLVARGETTVRDAQVSADSFPGFARCLASLGAHVERS